MSLTSTTLPVWRHPALGVISVRGVDARTFLQGQLSADLAALSPTSALLACCNSPQGRVQAVMWIIERREELALLVPLQMTALTAARLAKYVLRAKVAIDPHPPLSVASLQPDAAPAGLSLAQPGAHQEHDGISYLRLAGHSALVVLTATALAPPPPATPASSAGPVPSTEPAEPAPVPSAGPAGPGSAWQWRLEDIRAGLPQIYPATHESFVAQMLNLDLLGAISFRKGCYTGQEIIARTHYRGGIKRRMLRLRGDCEPPAPGTRILAGGEHAGDVVDAAPVGQGCEMLAVLSLARLGDELTLAGVAAAPLQRLDLPYQV